MSNDHGPTETLGPLAGYALFLQAWRMAAFDLPLAFAASVDGFAKAIETVESRASDRLNACDTIAEVVTEQAQAASEIAQAALKEADAFARDVDIIVEPLVLEPQGAAA